MQNKNKEKSSATDVRKKPYHCPHCGENMIRIKRDLLMRILPKSRHLYCENCHKRYLKFWMMNFKLTEINIHIL